MISYRGAPLNYPIPHDPDATLRYGWVWDKALRGDTIVSGEITCPDGDISIASAEYGVSETIDSIAYSQVVRALISGGSAGVRYPVTCQITTAAGQIMEATIIIRFAST